MRRFRARGNGIALSAVRFDPEHDTRATCLFVHGFMDAAASFDLVATRLASAGVCVIAPDMRGFGESDRAPRGGYYHFPDYVADVDAFAREILPEKFIVVGHSMGGTIATYFASARPERVTKLALLEGMGPPDAGDEMFPIRMKKWLDDLEHVESDGARMSEADAMKRLVAVHPRVPRDVLASRLPHLARTNDDGTLAWRWDPLHRTTSPAPFFASAYRAFAKTIACRVLYVSGGALGWRVPDEAARLASFANAKHVDIPDAGHMMHWTAPDALANALIDFVDH
jgi:pimeloyl-ACP methyl ester carboxylesterase